MLELVASVNRKGIAGILARSVISSSKGVPNKGIHNGVQVWVGGSMGSVPTASANPIF